MTSIVRPLSAALLTAWSIVLAVPAAATAIAGPNGTAAQGRRTVPALPAGHHAAAATSLELSSGTITAVDASKRTVSIAGQTVALHPSRLSVVGPNGIGESGVAALRSGMRVRFALDPSSKAADRPIVLLYIDRP